MSNFYGAWEEQLKIQNPNLNIDQIKKALKSIVIETPSWGYADSGTRFGIFAQKEAAKTLAQKLEVLHKFTNILG